MAEVRPIPVDENADTLFIAILFNSGGLGVLSVQLYVYYLSFPGDSCRFRALVYGVYALEVIQTIMLCRTIFCSFVYGFLDEDSLDQIGDLWFSIPVLGALVSCSVQMFYAYRIILLGRLWERAHVNVVAIMVVTLALVQMGGGVALGVELKKILLFTLIRTPQIRLAAGVWYAGEAIGDIVIAISMTYILLRSGCEGTRNTRKITRKLIRLTIETGALTATMAMVTIVLVMFGGNKAYYQVSAGVVSKLYSNTLLVSLNGRKDAGVDGQDTHPNISRSLDFARTQEREIRDVEGLDHCRGAISDMQRGRSTSLYR